jgi:hypothetical protein
MPFCILSGALYPGKIFRFKACLYAVLEFFCEFVQFLTHGGLFVGIECVQFFEQRQALTFYESRLRVLLPLRFVIKHGSVSDMGVGAKP